MSSGEAGSSAQGPRGGVYAALRYTGIPESWIRRPKLPSRNWLIFLSVTSSILGLYVYDRRKCKQIRDSYVRRVEHLAQEKLGSLEMPRKVMVYACKWPGDEDYNRSLKYFRKYVKPVLVAAAVDYEILNGNRHGTLADVIANRIKSKRRIEAGLDKPSQGLIPTLPRLSPEQEQRKLLEGGTVVIGRHTFKEYMEGLKRGWTESLRAVDREEALAQQLANDGHFDEPELHDPSAGLEGEPIPTPSRLASSNAAQIYSPLKMSSAPSSPRKPHSDSADDGDDVPPPAHIPPQPPLLLVPFTNHIGLTQIPIMIGDFFNQRAKVKSGAEAAYRLVIGHHRPISVPSTPSSPDMLDFESQAQPETQAINDLDFDTACESYYPSSTRSFASDIEKARSDYYAALPAKLAIARALARGEREPTKDETNHPPPSEVELRAERLKKELRWKGDLEGWEILNPQNGVAWDERFRDALRVFVDPPGEMQPSQDKTDSTGSS